MDRHCVKKQASGLGDNYGFTLIELVLVLAIFSIILAMAIPGLNKTVGRFQLEISAGEMASNIRTLQQSALKTQSGTYSILWDIEHETYYLCHPGTTAFKTVKLPPNVDIFSAPIRNNFYQLGFQANGSPDNGFGGTVTLKDRSTGISRYVVVDKLGRVRISDTYPTS